MGFAKADVSVSTMALSEEMSQQELSALDLASTGGTPLSKILRCCLPQSRHDEEVTPLREHEEDEVDSPPPIVMAKVNTVDTDPTCPETVQEKNTALFDNGLIFQIAILSGFLAGQACNVF